jgi:hypothetical protein
MNIPQNKIGCLIIYCLENICAGFTFATFVLLTYAWKTGNDNKILFIWDVDSGFLAILSFSFLLLAGVLTSSSVVKINFLRLSFLKLVFDSMILQVL